MSVFYQGDSLHLLKTKIPDKSVNLIYIDPPFGTTQNFWDEGLDWPKYFTEFFRVLKDDGMLVIHCSIPFNYELIRSAPKPPSYSWYWLKDSPTSPLLANYQPLRQVEEILVWKKKKVSYYRQQIGTEMRRSTYMTKTDYYGKTYKFGYTQIKGKTRTHFLQMKRELDGYSTRPKEMVKLMIDSYSKKGDTILDCFCYKGLTFTQSQDRRWIGMDKYHFPQYFLQVARPPPPAQSQDQTQAEG
jgi:site-specific DNA-methyltransferase (adenine-specific)